MDATDKCPGFAQLPRALMRQFPSPYVWAVYACIHDHGWGSADGCWASIQTMSAETGVNHHKIREVLKVLDAHGWITTEMRPGRSTVYRPRLEASLQSDPFKKLKGSPLLQESEGVAQQVQMPPVQEIEGGPLQECEGPPLQDLEDKQEPNNKNPITRTQQQEPPINPPLIPPTGGTAYRPWIDRRGRAGWSMWLWWNSQHSQRPNSRARSSRWTRNVLGPNRPVGCHRRKTPAG